jgi:Ni,Fe-hydrogenase III component G
MNFMKRVFLFSVVVLTLLSITIEVRADREPTRGNDIDYLIKEKYLIKYMAVLKYDKWKIKYFGSFQTKFSCERFLIMNHKKSTDIKCERTGFWKK